MEVFREAMEAVEEGQEVVNREPETGSVQTRESGFGVSCSYEMLFLSLIYVRFIVFHCAQYSRLIQLAESRMRLTIQSSFSFCTSTLYYIYIFLQQLWEPELLMAK